MIALIGGLVVAASVGTVAASFVGWSRDRERSASSCRSR